MKNFKGVGITCIILGVIALFLAAPAYIFLTSSAAFSAETSPFSADLISFFVYFINFTGTFVHVVGVSSILFGAALLSIYEFKKLSKVRLGLLNLKDFLSLEYILLEVRAPDQSQKPIDVMESFFESIYSSSSDGKFKDRILLGKTRPIYSFEIASNGGETSFYIRVRSDMKEIVVSNLFAFFPNFQITEVEDDYVDASGFDERTWNLWCGEWTLDSASELPIKTYLDFKKEGQSIKDLDSEAHIDPINSLVELCGSMKRDERAWIQIVVRAYKKDEKERKSETFFSKDFYELTDSKDKAASEVGKLLSKQDDVEVSLYKRRLAENIEKKSHKSVFEVGIRTVYCAPRVQYRKALIPVIKNMFRVFSSELNSFKTVSDITKEPGPFANKKQKQKIKNKSAKELFDYYRQRLFFFPPVSFKGTHTHAGGRPKPFQLSIEELATIYHFPSFATETPTLKRASGNIISAPKNIPRQ